MNLIHTTWTKINELNNFLVDIWFRILWSSRTRSHSTTRITIASSHHLLKIPIMIILIPTNGYSNIGKIRLQFEDKTEVDPLPDMWHPIKNIGI